MTIDGRDRVIVATVARFGQLSSSHVSELVFSGLASRTPCKRALKRLSERGYLHRIERRMVGGSRGGSGQFVYQLGRRGFQLFNDGVWRPWRTVNYHDLAVADCFVSLRQAERAGVITVNGFSSEPDCWVTIGRHELRPDLFFDVSVRDKRGAYWLEMDMATEGQKRLQEKLTRYWQAWNEADTERFPEWPTVLWVAVDNERAKELSWLIARGPAEAQQMFRVTTRAGLVSSLVG